MDDATDETADDAAGKTADDAGPRSEAIDRGVSAPGGVPAPVGLPAPGGVPAPSGVPAPVGLVASGGGGGRGRMRLVLAATVLASIVAAVLVVRAGNRGTDPDAALERARAQLEAASSYRLTITTEDRTGGDALAGPGTLTITRVVDEIEVSAEGWHSVSDAGDWAEEMLVVGDTTYDRSADSREDLGDELWAAWPVTEDTAGEAVDMVDVLTDELVFMTEDMDENGGDDYVDDMLVSMVGPLYLGGFGDQALAGGWFGGTTVDPAGLVTTLAELEDAEVVAEAGGQMTIRATRQAPPEVVDAVDLPVPAGEFEVVLDAEDRPVSLALTVEDGDARFQAQVEFRDWGAAVTAAAPAEGDIDPTPLLDEDALEEARAEVTPVRPTVLPEGIEMQDIYPISTEEAGDWGEGCAQLNLVYGPPMPPMTDGELPEDVFDEAMYDDYLDLYLVPLACAQANDATPFAPGRFGDVPTREVDGIVEVLVGDTVVQIDTTFTAELPAMVASIQPFDLDAEIARLTALAEEMWGGTPPF